MIYDFLDAHGYDPGPSQRPMLAGAISGLLATVPAIGILIAFGSLAVEAQILGMSRVETLAVGWPRWRSPVLPMPAFSAARRMR